MRAQFVLQEVWTGLRRNLTMTIALIVVVAISLSLLGTGLLFVKQVNNTRTYWQGKVQLSIYLCTATSVSPQCQQNGPATAAEKAQIASDLKALPQVQRVLYESQEQAYLHFKQDFSREPVVHQPGQQVRDPRLVPGQAPQHADGLHRSWPAPCRAAPGVDQIVDDSSLLASSTSCWTAPGTRVVIIAIILIIAAILLVANTIRLSAFNRRRETSASCAWSAPRTSTFSCPSWSRGCIAGLFGWLIAAGPADRGQVARAGYAAAVLPLQRPAQRHRPGRGHTCSRW